MAASIICGPVVGLVTHNITRVLLEVDKDETVTMVLHDKQGSDDKSLEQLMPAKEPRAFHFDNLRPNTHYQIIIQNDKKGSFTTLAQDVQQMRVGVVSCNFPERKSKKDMWKELYHWGKRQKLNVILHLGDNIYIDGAVSDKFSNEEQVQTTDQSHGIFDARKVDQSIPYVQARKLLEDVKNEGPEVWHTRQDAILEIYRARYRYTWGVEYTAKVLSHFSNLMMLDDHEIRDDFGLREEDGDPTSMEFFLGKLALQVYHEYQRQLWDPTVLLSDKESTHFNEFYTIRLGPLGIAMMDARTPNSIYKPRRHHSDESYYGNEQTEALFGSLNTIDSTRMWLLGCALPLLFFKREINETLTKLFKTKDDLEVFIRRCASDLLPIWDSIKSWKEKVGPAGDVMILSGDVHVGGFTDIYYEAENGQHNLLCHQLTTSPICNDSWGDVEFAVAKVLKHYTDEYHGYEYEHYEWVNRCNFATITVDFQDKGQVRYDVCLVPEKKRIRHKRSDHLPWDNQPWFKKLLCL